MEEELDLEQIAIISVAQLLTAIDVPAGLTALFGDRMFPVNAPDNTQSPYLVFSQAMEETMSTKDGQIPDGWSFVIDLYAEEYQELKRGARFVRRSINGKEATVEGIGKLHLLFSNDGQEVYDEKRELLTLSLEFRGIKIS